MRRFCSRSFVLLSVAILILIWFVASVNAEKNLIRAKIGVLKKSGKQTGRAMAEDRLKAGDMIRIYVQPELPAYVYVIHCTRDSLALLNIVRQQISSATVLLPSIQGYYQIDGKSRTEKITIICSPQPLEQVAAIADDRLTIKQWMEIEKDLTEKSRINIGERLQKPFSLAGNVREGKIEDPFVDQLPIYVGKGMLVKIYAFEIEK